MVTPYYQDSQVSLFCGDMRDVLPVLGQFDACVTDPPYGETSLAWDRWPDGWPALVAGHTRSMWTFGSMRMFLRRHGEIEAARWKIAQDFVGEFEIDTMVWEKNAGSGPTKGDRFNRVHELAVQWYQGLWRDIYHETPRVPTTADKVNPVGLVISRPGAATHRGEYGEKSTSYLYDGLIFARTVVKAKNIRRRRHWTHPTEKPGEVIAPLIECSVPLGGIVLDPFAGSCSTGVTARQLGRRAVCIEADEATCEKAAERLSIPDLFSGDAA